MPESGTSTLLRLVLSLGTTGFYLPESLSSGKRKAGYETPGIEVPPEIAKTGANDIFIACSIGKSYGFSWFKDVTGGFRAKI
jgi:hypothetical protein